MQPRNRPPLQTKATPAPGPARGAATAAVCLATVGAVLLSMALRLPGSGLPWAYAAAGLSFLVFPLAWRGVRSGTQRTLLFGAVWLALWQAAVWPSPPAGVLDFEERFAAVAPGLTPSQLEATMGQHPCFFVENQFTPLESRAAYTGRVRVLADAPETREGWVVFRDGRVTHTESWPQR